MLRHHGLHHFVITRGKTMDMTPQFMAFQGAFPHVWGGIVSLIRIFERRALQFAVPLMWLDGCKVAALAEIDLGMPTHEQLMGCVVNRSEVEAMILHPGQRFCVGKDGYHSAAKAIQAVVRMHLQRRRYDRLRLEHSAARSIQKGWELCQAHLETRRRIMQSLKEREMRWQQICTDFAASWPEIRKRPRLVVHIPSLSLPHAITEAAPYLDCIQNAQMAGRLCDLMDPNVSVIYVAPFSVEPAVVQYYAKILSASGIRGVDSRVTVLTPENAMYLPEGISLTKAALWSPRLLKELQRLTHGKTAYIVPGLVGSEEQTLAAHLQLPLLSLDSGVSMLFATKSGTKRIFDAADVPIPPGVSDLSDDTAMLQELASLIVANRDVPRWVLKIDNGFASHGTAFLDVSRLRSFKLGEGDNEGEWQGALLEELRVFGAKLFKVSTPFLYPTWPAFLRGFRLNGGIIEAAPAEIVSCPQVNLFIHPNGDVDVRSCQEQVVSPPLCRQGCMYPQTHIPEERLESIGRSIGRACFEKNIFGYASVDLVAFRREGELQLWAVDLDLQLTDSAAIHELLLLVCGGLPAATTRLCSRNYLYSGIIHHPQIANLQHSTFFTICKQKGISFDMQEKVGSLFHLVDSLARGCFGVMCSGLVAEQAVAYLAAAVEFIQLELDNTGIDESDTNLHHVAAACRALNRHATGPVTKAPRKLVRVTQSSRTPQRDAELPLA
eukprot:NODE_70_length_3522_cov_45.796142_g62_i0.p1 GENE.NODE_70_length_3522_cov_45.796142_g62_i0~~NODE_70_length_3522_cov_45.796142_g62_i0.p1  ORF type:complete len:721 (+),score=127.27 NODE_70_length_3522_cov_45.796142_g62_i0:1197-3359(+)